MHLPDSVVVVASAPVVEIETRAALVAASGDDVFVRCSAPLAERVTAWSLGRGVAWFTDSRRRSGAGWLTVVADPKAVRALVRAAADHAGPQLAGVTVPAAGLALLPEADRPPDYNLWDWFSSEVRPPLQAGEDAVTWAGPEDEPAIVRLLDTDSPRHSARPGDSDVLRWCVISGDDGQLVACAALTEHVPSVAHLASIVTRTDQRGRGLGRAITAWITRRLLDEGRPVVTLGMYADNDPARRMYLGLGFVCAHEFASGYLRDRREPGDADPVQDEAD